MISENILSQLNNNSGIAVSENNKEWTYKEFLQYTIFARDYFTNSQIEKVMFCLPQGFYAYALTVGAYLSNTIFCPINLNLPKERKEYYMEIFEPSLIISVENDLGSITPETFFQKTTHSDIDIDTSRKHLTIGAYVIFTSGSTGFPKGVLISRKGLENFLSWSTKTYNVQKNDIWGQFSNLGFDLSICDIFTAIICGATIVPIASYRDKLFPGDVIRRKKITFWHSVPSVIDIINKAGHLTKENFRHLKTMSFCGEKLYSSQLEMIFNANPTITVYNTYGPTETTIFCTQIQLTIENYKSFSKNSVCLGHPIEGYEISLSNPRNGIGEILIISEYIGIGYLRELNSVNTSYNTITRNRKKIRVFNTGDLGKFIDGSLYFEGRNDSQIKILGNRIDMSEIDEHLRQYGCVSSVTIFNEEKIISFVICLNSNESDIFDFLRSKLPIYYLPVKIIFCEEFPYNPSGKVDLIKLKDLLKQ